MSKKTNQKKKINIKLEDNQSFIVEDLDVLMHIQKHYAMLIKNQMNETDKSICLKVINAINHAIENVYIAPSDGYSENW